MKMRKMLLVLLVFACSLTLFGCKKPKEEVSSYTYKSWTTALGSNWNPHTWETSADSSMLGYVSSPFVDMSIENSEDGVYQWVYEMAESVTDTTKENYADLEKYGTTLPEGQTAAEQESGYVFDIALNKNAKWENGEEITADDYIESMKRLLDPAMKNYRANLYYDGESAIAGAYEYYWQGTSVDQTVVAYPEYPVDGVKPAFDITALMKAGFGCNPNQVKGSGYDGYVQLADGTFLYDKYPALFGGEGTDNEFTEANVVAFMTDFATTSFFKAMGMVWGDPTEVYNILANSTEALTDEQLETIADASYIFTVKKTYPAGVEYDNSVGVYKVDDYTIRYVLETYQDFNYFLTSLTSTWLVYTPLYDDLKDTSGDLVTTTYGTSKETTMSYGTYKIETLQKDKQIVYVQNENWYGFTKLENGSLYSETNFLVDGKKVQQYQTTKIIIDVMTEDVAKQKFFAGELADYSPTADELSSYSLSDQLYKVDETYTMSFFFNTNVDMLKTMDESKGNTYSVVLSNEKFRNAFSLAIDRAEWVTATAAYKPAYSLMNDLYFYDVYNDPTSKYRASDEAMQAIVNLYGVEYGEGKTYATLKEAYESINGYNLTEAKKLMAEALAELVEDELYKAGEKIHIRIGWAKGALTSDDNAQLSLMNKYINAAASEAGFGEITLEAIGNITNRYADVPKGEYAIGYGAWGGAAFYPFRNFQVYMDPDQYDINEAANWDPTTEELTLKVNGEDVTMTYQAWSQSMMGTGKFATADFETKLAITAQLEEIYLKKYYRIPLAATTVCTLLSYQVKYYTEDYNIMYGFGGLRLMTYNYDDANWAKYVADQGGTLKYN